MRFPLALLDFEASSLEQNGFPIEVGLAIANAPGNAAETWSALITPAREWVSAGDWSASSQAVHRITREDLAGGLAPRQVAEELNIRCAPIGTIWCDGGGYDQHWLERLYAATGLRPSFSLLDISGLFLFDRRAHNRFAEALSASEPTHRAGPDAERICLALVNAFT